MKKYVLILLLFFSLNVNAETTSATHPFCRDSETHDQLIARFHDAILDTGLAARERGDTSDQVMTDFMQNMYFMIMQEGMSDKAYQPSELRQSEKYKNIVDGFSLSDFNKAVNMCCSKDVSSGMENCFSELIMGSLYYVAVKEEDSNSSKNKDLIADDNGAIPKCTKPISLKDELGRCFVVVENKTNSAKKVKDYYKSLSIQYGVPDYLIRIANKNHSEDEILSGESKTLIIQELDDDLPKHIKKKKITQDDDMGIHPVF